MNRKDFIINCCIACAGTLVGGAMISSCNSNNYYAKTSFANNKIVVKKSEFNLESDNTQKREYVLVKSIYLAFPIYLHRKDDNNFTGLLMRCTHKACELQAEGEYLICPCHGSEFTNEGIVQNPPANENIKPFITTTDNENIYIQI